MDQKEQADLQTVKKCQVEVFTVRSNPTIVVCNVNSFLPYHPDTESMRVAL